MLIKQGKTNIKYLLIVVILATIIAGGILGYQSFWTEEEVKMLEIETPREKDSSQEPPLKEALPQLSPQEKCENSGGEWTTECSSVGCIKPYCNCAIGEAEEIGNKTIRRTKIAKNDTCISCQLDDCNEKSCSMGRNECISFKKECVNGICIMVEESHGSFFERTHDCIEGECIFCGDTCVTK